MWSLDYVQVPEEEKLNIPANNIKKEAEILEEVKKVAELNLETTDETESDNTLRRKRVQSLVNQMSVSAELSNTEEGLIVKSGSESSLSGDEKVQTKQDSDKEEKERCSDKEDRDRNDYEKQQGSNPVEIRKLSFDNKSKSEESKTNSLMEEPQYNVWRRPSCKGDLHRQEAIVEGMKSNSKSGQNRLNMLAYTV